MGALSGIQKTFETDRVIAQLFPGQALLNWLDMARERVAFQGLREYVGWVMESVKAGLAFNELVRTGKVTPINWSRPSGLWFGLPIVRQKQ